jgi:hypothetical protein
MQATHHSSIEKPPEGRLYGALETKGNRPRAAMICELVLNLCAFYDKYDTGKRYMHIGTGLVLLHRSIKTSNDVK